MNDIVRHAGEIDRVRANTWPEINEQLDQEIALRLRDYAGQNEEQLTRKLRELDREWNFERVLEAESSTMGLLGLALSLAVSPRFLMIPGFVAAMVLLHALHGWYPLLPLFRGIGVRTQDEIDRERYAVKALRGDFAPLARIDGDNARRAAAAWSAVWA